MKKYGLIRKHQCKPPGMLFIILMWCLRLPIGIGSLWRCKHCGGVHHYYRFNRWSERDMEAWIDNGGSK